MPIFSLLQPSKLSSSVPTLAHFEGFGPHSAMQIFHRLSDPPTLGFHSYPEATWREPTMTVRELIRKLQEQDPEDKVAVREGTCFREARILSKGFMAPESKDREETYPNVGTVFLSG